MINYFRSSLQELNISLDINIFNELILFWSYLLKNNEIINLISRKNAITKNSIINHLTDSLTPLLFKFSNNLDVLDIGSGGGFPSIPLKIVNKNWNYTLFEHNFNKFTFLNDAIHYLKLNNIRVINQTITKNDIFLRQSFDLITVRGYDTISRIIPIASNFIKSDGFIIIFKGPKGLTEYTLSDNILNKYNFKLFDKIKLSLPLVNTTRYLFIFKKC
jgi:16S rRNA (guanine527-N7)-methyltransferase